MPTVRPIDPDGGDRFSLHRSSFEAVSFHGDAIRSTVRCAPSVLCPVHEHSPTRALTIWFMTMSAPFVDLLI